MRPLLSLLVLSCCFCPVRAETMTVPPPELPVATFFGNPAMTQLRFSPSGRYLAALVPHEKRLNLVVMDLETKARNLITGFRDYGISTYQWANDGRLVMLMDDDGDEDYLLFAIDRDGKNFDRYEQAASSILRRDRSNPRRVLVYSAVTHRDRIDPCWMDVKTGKLSVITRNPGNFNFWVIDRANVPRLGVVDEGAVIRYLYRDKPGDEWRQIAAFRDGEPRWEPLGFDGDNRTLFVAADLGRKTLALYRYDTATHRMGELVFGDDTYDVDDVIWSELKQRVVGVSYQAERSRVIWFDEDFSRRQRIIDGALPGLVNVQQEATDDGKRVVIFSSSDREPGVYYLFDDANRKIEEMAVTRPNIDPALMAPMKPVVYTARDGVEIHGYLTLPVGRPAKNLPLVINPHGGPFGIRDEWRFNPEVQMLANRGFAVLQPNYRGSGGYGQQFERLGYRQWGRTMQDDLTDGVKWAVGEGIADPQRIVILGASYGGYAVMAGLAFTPELYRAGVNYVGVTDLKIISSQRRRNDMSKLWTSSRVGDRFADKAELNARSPVNFAANIRVPVLMAYGVTDPRVTREHGDDMRAALKKHGKEFEFIIEKNEGHGFRSVDKSIGFYEKVDAFLKKHVPARQEP